MRIPYVQCCAVFGVICSMWPNDGGERETNKKKISKSKLKFGERADMIAYNPTIDDLHNCLKRNVWNYYLKFLRNLFNYSKAYMVFRHISIIYIINIIIIMEWWLKQTTKEGKQFRWIFVSVRIENSNCNLFGATFDEWRVRANIFAVYAIRLFVTDNVGFFFTLSLSLRYTVM